jgi:hypothetical protein
MCSIPSVNFGALCAQEDHDRFVICQVPCYTEGDTSLQRTVDSLAQMKYNDKRKLLIVICDSMIDGCGNGRPASRIVLNVLGADPNFQVDPEPLNFVSLGEGAKQHNMGEVYSGFYECAGHIVQYPVLVKIGKPAERSCPGSTMICADALSRHPDNDKGDNNDTYVTTKAITHPSPRSRIPDQLTSNETIPTSPFSVLAVLFAAAVYPYL